MSLNNYNTVNKSIKVILKEEKLLTRYATILCRTIRTCLHYSHLFALFALVRTIFVTFIENGENKKCSNEQVINQPNEKNFLGDLVQSKKGEVVMSQSVDCWTREYVSKRLGTGSKNTPLHASRITY